uniref:Uncharacterized protein n=1 Tax=Manihot esculenta TaxID=3983 RepID=A0A2C9W336_MANES
MERNRRNTIFKVLILVPFFCPLLLKCLLVTHCCFSGNKNGCV